MISVHQKMFESYPLTEPELVVVLATLFYRVRRPGVNFDFDRGRRTRVSDSPVSLNNLLSLFTILSSRVMRVSLKPYSLPSALGCIHRSPRLRRLLRTQAQYEYTPREHYDFSEFPRSAGMATPRQVI